jgi:hypothetical protein
MTQALAILRHVRDQFRPMRRLDWLVFGVCIGAGATFDVQDEWMAGAGWHGR